MTLRPDQLHPWSRLEWCTAVHGSCSLCIAVTDCGISLIFDGGHP